MRLSISRTLLALTLFALAAPLAAQSQAPTYRIAPLAGTYSVPATVTASEALFSQPAAVAADNAGNLFVADTENYVLRRIGVDGRVTIVAGTGVLASPGAAAGEQLARVNTLALYQNRYLYFGEETRIRRLDLTNGRLEAVTTPALTKVSSLTVDSAGTLYYVDAGAIHAVDTAGVSRTVITGLNNPGGLTTDRTGNLFFAETGPDGKARLRRILASDPSGVTTVASLDPLAQPSALALSADGGVVYLADPVTHRIARLDLGSRALALLAGDGIAGFAGENDRSRLSGPSGITVTPDGAVVFADTQNLRIRRLGTSDLTTVAGRWNSVGESANAVTALVGNPNAKPDRLTGGVLIAENNSCAVRGVTTGGVITTVAGRIGVCRAMTSVTSIGEVTFNRPVAATRDARGNIFVADATGAWAISASDRNARQLYVGAGVVDLALDPAGAWLYLALSQQHLVVRVNIAQLQTTGEPVIETVAGTGRAGFSGEGGPGTRAQLDRPTSLAFSGQGDLLIVDSGNARLRRVTLANRAIVTVADIPGVLTVAADQDFVYLGYLDRVVRLDGTNTILIAGANEFGLGVEAGDPLQARFTDIAGLCTLADRSLIVSDFRNHRVRRIIVTLPTPPPSSGGGTGGTPPPTPAPLGPPRITRIIGASSFGAFSAVSPGSWIEIYGENLSASTRQWAGSDFADGSAPTALDGVRVFVGGKNAFLQLVSPTQLNAIVPEDVATGQGQPVYVDRGGTRSALTTLRLDARAPAFLAPPSFRVSQIQYVVAQLEDGAFAGPLNLIPGAAIRPAQPGDRLILFGTGFGETSPRLPVGAIVNEATALPNVSLRLAGLNLTVEYAGFAFGFVGLYQFNVIVPAAVPAGDLSLTGTVDGVPLLQRLFVRVE
jgi:uncharacterized protein (TIGR03437 family)